MKGLDGLPSKQLGNCSSPFLFDSVNIKTACGKLILAFSQSLHFFFYLSSLPSCLLGKDKYSQEVEENSYPPATQGKDKPGEAATGGSPDYYQHNVHTNIDGKVDVEPLLFFDYLPCLLVDFFFRHLL